MSMASLHEDCISCRRLPVWLKVRERHEPYDRLVPIFDARGINLLRELKVVSEPLDVEWQVKTHRVLEIDCW